MTQFRSDAAQLSRRTLRNVALRAVELPLHLASALTWWLQGIQARLQTALANEEARR